MKEREEKNGKWREIKIEWEKENIQFEVLNLFEMFNKIQNETWIELNSKDSMNKNQFLKNTEESGMDKGKMWDENMHKSSLKINYLFPWNLTDISPAN